MEIDKVSVVFRFKEKDTIKDIVDKIKVNHTIASFLYQSRESEVTITVEENNKTNEKIRMYAYLNGVLIPTLIKAKRNQGDVLDKTECMLQMKMLFAKDVVTDNSGDQVFVIMSQSDMSKQRLVDFITDIIFHLESEYGIQAPDSEEYKLKLLNSVKNKNFRKV